MRFLRALFADMGLLGLAVAFGWALWFTVRAELNEVARRPVQVAFEVEDGIDVDPHTRTVVLDVQGPRRAVDVFRTIPNPKLVRRVALSDLPPGADETRRDYAKEDFVLADSLAKSALTVVDMDPPVVGVRLLRVAVEEKTVAPPEFRAAAELSLRHVLQSYTASARVRGAVSALATFREIRTYVSKEQLQGFAESLRDTPKATVRLTLDVDPSQRELFTLVEPLELSARVELSRVAEQELVLPVQIYAEAASRGSAPRRIQFAEINKPHLIAGSPPRVRLTVTGVPSALAALATSHVRAFVLASDLPDEQRNGDVPVHVADLPPGVALQREYSVYVEVGP